MAVPMCMSMLLCCTLNMNNLAAFKIAVDNLGF
jgi:hypothetical protein